MRKLQIQSLDEEDVFAQRRNGVSTYGEEDDVQVSRVEKRNARGKAAIIYSLWSLFLTPLAAITFSKIFQITEFHNISAGFKQLTRIIHHLCFLSSILLPASLDTILDGYPVRFVCSKLVMRCP